MIPSKVCYKCPYMLFSSSEHARPGLFCNRHRYKVEFLDTATYELCLGTGPDLVILLTNPNGWRED